MCQNLYSKEEKGSRTLFITINFAVIFLVNDLLPGFILLLLNRCTVMLVLMYTHVILNDTLKY